MAVTTQQKTVVLYPSLGVGHLNPMVELAKLFLRRGHAVVIAVVNPPDKDAVSSEAIDRLAAANPAITFRLLPVPSSSNNEHFSSNPILHTIDVLSRANTKLRELLRSLPAVHALVVDMFCVDALDVAAEVAIPAYFFFASAVGDLAVMLHLPYYYPAAPSSFKDMGTALLRFPGVPPIRALDMSTTMSDRESDIAKERLRQYTRMPEARGFLANSFDWLESRALEALRHGFCTPGRSTPPVYCIGPLVLPGQTAGERRHPCLEWLDAQPERSVVFLCFGSLGTFSAAQLGEVARGLQNSGHRFLWVVRDPPEQKDESVEPDLAASLPEGFLEKTADRGFVVKNWAPQAEVLQHRAVGAFVTHCGWNSVLEGIVSGVPMICWPLYAEQRMNKVHVVEEMKVGVAVEGYDEEIVKAEEVEAKVRLVMSSSSEGDKLKERLPAAKKMAADAVKEGGSSNMAFEEFLRDMEKCSSKLEKKSM